MAREPEALRMIDDNRRSLDNERITRAPFKLRAMEEAREKLESLQHQITHQQENQLSLEDLVKQSQLSQITGSTSPPRRYHRRPPAAETTECWNCGRKGHYRQDCPQNEQGKDSRSGNEKEMSQKARGAVWLIHNRTQTTTQNQRSQIQMNNLTQRQTNNVFKMDFTFPGTLEQHVLNG